MSWETIAKEAQASVLHSIPERWRLDIKKYSSLKDVTDVPRTCGLLSGEQLEITELTATEIVSRLESRQLTAVQVLEAFAGRAAIAHQLTNCLTEFFYEEGLAQAKALDDALKHGGHLKGPLHGLPIALKDIHNIKGHATTMAWVALKDNIAQQDSNVVAAIRDAGAVFFCKTTMPQSAMAIETVSNLWGRTLNPKNTDLNCGGSSGGDAVLVAMRGTPFTPSTDLGGSVRVPAAFNGLYGLKPTASRTPKGGMPDMGQNLIQVSFGPICHSIEDAELLTRVINAYPFNKYDVTCAPVPWKTLRPIQERLRIGIMKWDGVVMPHPPVLQALKHTRNVLEMAGHEGNFEDISKSFTQRLTSSLLTKIQFDIYYQGGAGPMLAVLAASGEPPIPPVAALLKTFNFNELPTSEILQLSGKAREYKEAFLTAWNNATNTKPMDALICPPAPSVGYPHDYNAYWGYTSLFNLLDYPAAILPIKGFSIDAERCAIDTAYQPLDSNPFDKPNHDIYDPNLFASQRPTIQIVGRPFEDEKLIQVAAVFDKLVNAA
ncbi:hypothetical protein FLONG3_3020 [Fusarium longipes]|uniref:Amidase domain-containing protein n=1 Tax=Fusarium longipes TaxID=694270 RepID=A0A395T3B7_9HYPO|nr:hypothetical protein FLONG3_3020 [Fusarium longipes]